MIPLFYIPQYIINTADYDHLLHGRIVTEFENEFAEYVGAKYAVMANSATSLIYLVGRYTFGNEKPNWFKIPTIIPPVVPNALLMAGKDIEFHDDFSWVGHRYALAENFIDSAQEVTPNVYSNYTDDTVMIFSFYPTKPIGGCDGGMLVCNEKSVVDRIRTLIYNGADCNTNSWDRVHKVRGYKMHPNSIQAEIAFEGLKRLNEKHQALDMLRDGYNRNLGYNNTSRHLYRIRVPNNREFVQKMADVGIQCGIHYTCAHKQPTFHTDWMELPNSVIEAQQTVSLPFHDNLRVREFNHIVESVKGIGYLNEQVATAS